MLRIKNESAVMCRRDEKKTEKCPRLFAKGCFFFAVLMLLHPSTVFAFVEQERIAFSKGLAHYAMGQIYDYLGLTNRAVFEYEKASQFDEASYIIRLRLGADYARLNLLPEAIEQLKRVNSYNPEDLQAHYLLALIYSTQKEYDMAATEYEFILKSFSEAEPQNIEIYSYLGQLYYSQKRFDQAVQQFEKILEIEPDNADVMYLLGSLYLEINQKEKAITILKRSIEVNPEHDGSLNTLGYIYAEENAKLDEALSLIQRALVIDPDNGAYLDSLGWIHYKMGQHEKALEILLKAAELLKDPVIYAHLGDIYFTINRYEDASKYWELSLELLPGQEEIIRKLNDLKNIQASK